MCRLYGLRATEPSKIECQLVHAQNALMEQSRENMAGRSHAHGWGVVTYRERLPRVEKQAWAAYHGEHFAKTAARSYSDVVIAHVRHATVGPATIENTHPFKHGRFAFAHNGTVPNFGLVQEPMIAATDPLHRNEIHGTTDSEHIFRYLLSLWERDPGRPLVETLRLGLQRILAWSREIDPEAPVSLNVLWSDGQQLVGSRLRRTLWYLERDGVPLCEICGKTHVRHHRRRRPPGPYRAIELASEPVTGERWLEVPDATVCNVDEDYRLHFFPLEPEQVARVDSADQLMAGRPV